MNFFKFIRKYATMEKPLYGVTRSTLIFSWKSVFKTLRSSLIEGPVLLLADVKLPFQVHTDASNMVIASALMQQDKNKEWCPVTCANRKLTPEWKYTAAKKGTLWFLLRSFGQPTNWITLSYTLTTWCTLSSQQAMPIPARSAVGWIPCRLWLVICQSGKSSIADPLSHVSDSHINGTKNSPRTSTPTYQNWFQKAIQEMRTFFQSLRNWRALLMTTCMAITTGMWRMSDRI